MPEYVYALHDFLPEHEDEVSFLAGERIEVVEKDDLYGDGWWQGRNLAGKVGLFPQSYTTPAPPAGDALAHSSSSSSENTVSAPITDQTPGRGGLLPLDEVSESGSPVPTGRDVNIISPVPKTPAVILDSNENHQYDNSGHPQNGNPGGDGEVMKATMTDVQKAIEQLGRGDNGDADGGRSFSFGSTRDDQDTEGETDTEFDLSDMDTNHVNGDSSHKDMRAKLAEKARKAIEEAEKLEAIMNDRRSAPPIEVDYSDESDDEHVHDHSEFTQANKLPRNHSYILEEDENESDVNAKGNGIHTHEKEEMTDTTTASSTVESVDTQVARKQQDQSLVQTPPAVEQHIPEPAPPTEIEDHKPPTAEDPIIKKQSSWFISTFPSSPPSNNTQQQDTTSTPPNPVPFPVPETTHDSLTQRGLVNGTPPPSVGTESLATTVSASSGRTTSKHNSAESVSMPVTFLQHPVTTSNQTPLTASSAQRTLVEDMRKDKRSTSDWTVDEVADWLRSKGFDQDVCNKFIEQEITGDVLLELDVNLLKSEIGILAFGKRMRIANAITDLRRPPSIIYSDQPELSPLSPNSQVHSRTQSQSQSHHSFPGSGAAYPQSMQSSFGYGGGPGPTVIWAQSQGQSLSPGPSAVNAVDSPVNVPEELTKNVNGNGQSLGLAIGLAASQSSHTVNGKTSKGRPAHLTLSPSDSALKATARSVSEVLQQAEDEERGHMSEGEVAHTSSMRRRLFGRSRDSTQSMANSSRHSKEFSPIPSPTMRPSSPEKEKTKDKSKDKDKDKEKEKDKDKDGSSIGHSRTRKSVDGVKPERHSIFGNTLTLGRGRKPPPKYNSSSETDDKNSLFSLPRLHSSSMRRSSAHSRSATSTGSPKHSSTESKDIKPKSQNRFTILGNSEEKTKEKEKTKIKEREKDDDKEKVKDHKDGLLRKRTSSSAGINSAVASEAVDIANSGEVKQGQSILDQIGDPDHSGWMRKKGERYNSWKLRYFVLKGQHMYCLRSNSQSETKIKGYINIVGYRVTVDETLDPGRYGFRIDHDQDKTHFFSSDEKTIIREWMKAIMKATIDRDYTKAVVSSCNIPTIPLVVAQAMNPAPRPPSPTARDATQKALRRENPNQLSSRDARVLMGLPDENEQRQQSTSFDGEDDSSQTPTAQRMEVPPPRPSREMRRLEPLRSTHNVVDTILIEWANTHLPHSLQIIDPYGPLCGGLALLRLAESIRGRASSPPVPDSAFPSGPNDDKLDGLFRLFDYLLDNDVKMGSVSINDVRQGKRDKIIQLLRALKAWEEKRMAIAQSVGKGVVQAGQNIAPVSGW